MAVSGPVRAASKTEHPVITLRAAKRATTLTRETGRMAPPRSSRAPRSSARAPLTSQSADLFEMAVVVAREDLGELLERELPPFRVEPPAPPRRIGERAQEDQSVLP